ncbi:helix-turn-helix transcriptional regulator [Pseudomonas sp. JBR1]|nr:helix-turn-helix transcriptional regulator [Pseudomonas sp. JBR1]WCE09015.1 helix-turn-helix transcriptional regulator [Pseudomonas sp. JBR1]
MPGRDQKALAVSIGRAIATRRTRSGLTQDQVAERLGIGNEAISRIERGVVIPNIARLYDFASIFQCEAAELPSEASPRSDDQARQISRLLDGLTEAERQPMLGLVQELGERLRQG